MFSVICLQIKFEAQRKAEEERRRREAVRWKFRQDICIRKSSVFLKTITLSGADQEGGGERHTPGDPCRAGRVAADSRRSVNVCLPFREVHISVHTHIIHVPNS